MRLLEPVHGCETWNKSVPGASDRLDAWMIPEQVPLLARLSTAPDRSKENFYKRTSIAGVSLCWSVHIYKNMTDAVCLELSAMSL